MCMRSMLTIKGLFLTCVVLCASAQNVAVSGGKSGGKVVVNTGAGKGAAAHKGAAGAANETCSFKTECKNVTKTTCTKTSKTSLVCTNSTSTSTNIVTVCEDKCDSVDFGLTIDFSKGSVKATGRKMLSANATVPTLGKGSKAAVAVPANVTVAKAGAAGAKPQVCKQVCKDEPRTTSSVKTTCNNVTAPAESCTTANTGAQNCQKVFMCKGLSIVQTEVPTSILIGKGK